MDLGSGVKPKCNSKTHFKGDTISLKKIPKLVDDVSV